MNKKIKKLIWFAFLIAILISSLMIIDTYALLESSQSMKADVDLAEWTIKFNDLLATGATTTTLDINNFTYTTSTTIADGKIAPGRNGYFMLNLDPTGTQVAFKYEIAFILSTEYQNNISFSVTNETAGATVTQEANKFSGIVTLDQINSGQVISLKVNLNWTNDDIYNTQDTELGLVKNNQIVIPAEIKLIQYTGE